MLSVEVTLFGDMGLVCFYDSNEVWDGGTTWGYWDVVVLDVRCGWVRRVIVLPM